MRTNEGLCLCWWPLLTCGGGPIVIEITAVSLIHKVFLWYFMSHLGWYRWFHKSVMESLKARIMGENMFNFSFRTSPTDDLTLPYVYMLLEGLTAVIFTGSQYCQWIPLCVRLCVSQELIRGITHDPFKLGSPNLDKKVQNTLIKVPIIFGVVYLHGQISLQIKFYPILSFNIVCAINHHQFKTRSPNLDQRCKITCWRSLLVWLFP